MKTNWTPEQADDLRRRRPELFPADKPAPVTVKKNPWQFDGPHGVQPSEQEWKEAIEAHNETAYQGLEKDLQQLIWTYLRQRGVKAILQQRMDSKASLPVGVPDFIFMFKGRAYAIEVKVKDAQPRQSQEHMMAAMQADGWQVFVVRSLEAVKRILDTP